jgi:hypothetical protein
MRSARRLLNQKWYASLVVSTTNLASRQTYMLLELD